MLLEVKNMGRKKVSLSTCGLQKDFGDFETLKIVKEIGADGVDFCLYTADFDCRNPESIYSKSDDEIIVDFSDNRYAPFAITGMQKGQNLVRIEKCKGKDLEMSYVAADGTYYIYKLKKW